MLHAMRRNAFIGSVLKLAIYALIVIIPFWLYMQYLAPQVEKMLTMMAQIQGTSQSAQTQIGDWQKALSEFRAKIPGLSSTSTK